MDSEQNQDGWHGATSTYSSVDYSMQSWGDEGLQKLGEQIADVDSHIEKLRRTQDVEEQQESQDPFDYTPWIAALSAYALHQGNRARLASERTQASKANPNRSEEEPLAVGCSKKASISSQCT